MTIFDGVILVILIAAIVQGHWKGMAWQLAPIVSLIAGYIVAFPLAEQLAPWFGDKAPMNYILALLVLYLSTSLGVYLLARSLKEYIVKFKLEEYDKHLGAVLGGIKGLLFCLAIIFFSVAISASAREHIIQTHTGYASAILIDALHPVIPDGIHDPLEEYIHALDTPEMDLEHRHDHEDEIAETDHEESLLPPLPGHSDAVHDEVDHDSHAEPDLHEHTEDVSTTSDDHDQSAEDELIDEEDIVRGVLRILDQVTKE